jgi:hypothetical protein
MKFSYCSERCVNAWRPGEAGMVYWSDAVVEQCVLEQQSRFIAPVFSDDV